jgi:hypothetical protein
VDLLPLLHVRNRPVRYGFQSVHPGEKWSLIGHAAASFYALWMFGVLWPNHIKMGWRMRGRRPTGGTLFGVLCWLILSGFGLYYLGSDHWRSWTSLLHWAVGLAALPVFLFHMLTRRW